MTIHLMKPQVLALAVTILMIEGACSRTASRDNGRSDRGNDLHQSSPPQPKPQQVVGKTTTAEMLALAQKTLDLPSLQQYFHVKERPERSPLVVVAETLDVLGSKLTKFGQPVVFKREANVRAGEPIFRFKKVAIEGDKAVVEFEYPPEGLGGRATFARTGPGWEATDATVNEK